MSIHTATNKTIRDIESLLSCTYEQAQISNRWLSKQSVELQLWGNQQSVTKYLSFKKTHEEFNLNFLSLVSTLIISCEIHATFKKMHRKNINFVSDNLVLIDLLEINQFINKKPISIKKDTLNRKHSQILKWRKLGISFQKIATKILTIDGKSISHEYIRQFVNNSNRAN